MRGVCPVMYVDEQTETELWQNRIPSYRVWMPLMPAKKEFCFVKANIYIPIELFVSKLMQQNLLRMWE